MRAEAVRVTGDHIDGFADLRLTEHEAGAGPQGCCAVHPGVGDGTQAVGVGQVVAGRERLVLSGRAGNRHAPHRRVVHVCHRGGSVAGSAFRRSLLVDVARHHGDHFTDVRLA